MAPTTKATNAMAPSGAMRVSNRRRRLLRVSERDWAPVTITPPRATESEKVEDAGHWCADAVHMALEIVAPGDRATADPGARSGSWRGLIWARDHDRLGDSRLHSPPGLLRLPAGVHRRCTVAARLRRWRVSRHATGAAAAAGGVSFAIRPGLWLGRGAARRRDAGERP